MNKPSHARYAIPVLLLSAAMLTGCSFSASSRSSSGSSSEEDEKVVVQQAAPNYPEQLLQLDEAHDKKLISDKDYEAQRKKINDAMKKQNP